MNKLQELLAGINKANTTSARLYLITRSLKEGMVKNSRRSDKYLYQCWNINTDSTIQTELTSLFISKLDHISNEEKYSLTNYDVITDDAEKKILTYSQKEKVKPFVYILDEDLKNASELEYVANLEGIAKELWAYIVELSYDGITICGLRKMSPSKVMVAERHILLTQFNIKEKNLVFSNAQTVIFDKNLDVLYCDDTFFVIQKDNFEEIVGLEAEYREEARIAADKIMKSPLISLNYNLIDDIEQKNRFIRKLTKIKNKIDDLDSTRIKKMLVTAKLFKLDFKLDDQQKILINDDKQLDIVIKLLDDYYLISKQTDKKYEASVKKEIRL